MKRTGCRLTRWTAPTSGKADASTVRPGARNAPVLLGRRERARVGQRVLAPVKVMLDKKPVMLKRQMTNREGEDLAEPLPVGPRP